jgi:hypothetical protein
MLIRTVMQNHKQIVEELRKEKNDLMEQQRKDREASQAQSNLLHEKLLATNQRVADQLQSVIVTNTQAQDRSAKAMVDVEKTMRESVNKVSDGLREMSDHVEKSHECCEGARKASETTLRGVEGVAQSVRDLLHRPPRNPR